MLTTFLSSRFFSLPGASAVGMEEWKMKSLPLHSAAWKGKSDEREQIAERKKKCGLLLPDVLFIVLK